MMAQGDSLQRIQGLLADLFQLTDSADLDFGIYRVLNLKRRQVEDFILERLPKIVTEAFAHYAAADRITTERELEQKRKEIIETAEKLAAAAFDMTGQLVPAFRDTPVGKQFLDLEQKAKAGRVAEELQASVYNDLYTFFSRYYEEGDIFSRPRRGKVEIPFTGHEDVVLHWANRDQYYIKTGEQFKNYRFKADTFAVEFALRNASTEQNNNQGVKRYFVIAAELPASFDAQTRTLKVFLEYRALSDEEKITYGKTEQQKPQDKLNIDAAEAILKQVKEAALSAQLAKPLREEKPSLLLHHLTRYTRKNTADFFVHKNLRRFLIGELDDFLKAEVVRTNELLAVDHPEVSYQTLLRAQVVRRIAEQIIDFLAQVENFQKRLFEKRKFVVLTEYCIALDRVPEALWDEVLKNKAQVEEWRQLYALDDLLKAGGLFNRGVTKQFLRHHPHLVVDTRHFSEDFKWCLVATFDDLEAALDGLLVKSENFQALALLLEKYRGRVKCIYIDPPYNTGSDEFIYKDSYQHSCWLAMMTDRLLLGLHALDRQGIFFASIDDNETASLRRLLDTLFGPERFLSTLFIQVRYPEKTLTQDMLFHKLIEQVHVYAKDKKAVIREQTEYETSKFRWYVREKAKPKQTVQLGGKKVEVFTAQTYEIVEQEPSENGLKEIWATGKLLDGTSSGRFFRDFLAGRESKDGYGALYKVHGIGEDKFGFRYFTGPRKIGATKGKYYQGVPVTRLEGEGQMLDLAISNYFDLAANFGNCRHEGGVELRSGKKPEALLERLMHMSTRPGDLVLDFFAGSGTTCAVAQKMRRKWIGVEFGDYFDDKAKVRMQNVLNGEQTGISEESGWKGGGFFKYHVLEQCEDALNNLKLSQKKQGELAFQTFGDNYLLRYMLEFETAGSPSLLSPDQLRHPFAYKLKVQDGDEIAERSVDLVETFNYLLGLDVRKLREMRDGERVYRVVLGHSRNGKSVVVVWRDLDGLEDNNRALQRDRGFIEGKVLPTLLGKEQKPDRLLVNGECVVEEAESIEPEFHRLMFAPLG